MTTHNETQRPPALVNVDELADYLGVSSQAVRHMVYRRQIPFVRLGAKRLRFDLAEINAWIDAQRVEAAS